MLNKWIANLLIEETCTIMVDLIWMYELVVSVVSVLLSWSSCNMGMGVIVEWGYMYLGG